MQILSVTGNINFYNNRPKFVYDKSSRTNVQKDYDEIISNFYKDIDDYLGRKLNKKKYFINLYNNIKGLENFDKFSEAERQYLDELMITLDDVGGVDNLSDVYLTNLMTALKAKQNG